MKRELIERRIAELKKEHQAGEEQIRTLDQRIGTLKETMQRIAGAIQALEELLPHADPEA